MAMSDFRLEVERWLFHACIMKKCNMTIIYGRIAKIATSYRKSGYMNKMMTLNFKLEVEIWQFCTCTCENYAI